MTCTFTLDKNFCKGQKETRTFQEVWGRVWAELTLLWVSVTLTKCQFLHSLMKIRITNKNSHHSFCLFVCLFHCVFQIKRVCGRLCFSCKLTENCRHSIMNPLNRFRCRNSNDSVRVQFFSCFWVHPNIVQTRCRDGQNKKRSYFKEENDSL